MKSSRTKPPSSGFCFSNSRVNQDTQAVLPTEYLDVFQLPGAVADALSFDTHAVEHGEVEIGHRRFLVELDVPSRCEGPAAATREQDWQVVVVVAVAVA